MASTKDKISIRPMHPFPARMAPGIVLRRVPSAGRVLRILDPMTGSGTTLVTARARGHEAIGFDSDPLAVLISRAWCADVDPYKVHRKATEVMEEATSRYRELRSDEAYPRGADDETRKFVRYWFDTNSRRQLTALSCSIAEVHNPSVRESLWCAFSRLVITKRRGVSLAMDVSHSRPHRVYQEAPVKPFDRFTAAVRTVIGASPFKKPVGERPKASIEIGDARRLPLDDHSIDMVITSPPYLNAIDYLRGHKLSLVWMGYTVGSLRTIRSQSIGSEVSVVHELGRGGLVAEVFEKMGEADGLPSRFKRILVKYILDMSQVVSEIARVLVPGRHAVLVVGDSMLRGLFVQNSQAIMFLGKKSGMKLHSVIRRSLPDNRRYLPPPGLSSSGKQLQRRMREEIIIRFQSIL